jgi:KipI family sensor histidine kinase inhibitor
MGDRAVLVECADSSGAQAVAAALARSPVPGQRELVPGARSVLVTTDSGIDCQVVASHLDSVGLSPPGAAELDHVTIDVVYDGPDLAEVAELTGLGADGVIAAHTGVPWRVAFTGFAPGFGYLTGGDSRLHVPRRATPRPAVPAGSVGLAGEFSGAYPRESPGGWQLIGRTDAPLWDAHRDPPALLRPGTEVRFRAVPRLPVGVASASALPGAGSDLVSGAVRRNGRALTVVRPGISCLVEDLGRPGLAAEGVGRSGAADRRSAERANRIVGNRVSAALLELIPGRVEIRAAGALLVAVTGAAAAVQLDGERRQRDVPIAVGDGQLLTIAAPSAGLRCYLAVRGGIAVDPVLHSRSTDVLTGLGPRPIRPGDVLPVGQDHWGTPRVVAPPAQPPAGGDGIPTVTVLSGPQAEWFLDGLHALAGPADDVVWRVLPTSNRIGARLDGPAPRRSRSGELPSQGLVPGAIQVPPNGQPVIMLADHPVTGGYPVIGVVASDDLGVVAQLRPGGALWLRPRG